MKKCPFCAEDVQDAAIVCKHCGRDLVAREPDVAPPKVLSVGQRVGRLLVLAFLGVAAITLLVALFAGESHGPSSAAAPQPVTLTSRRNPTAAQLASFVTKVGEDRCPNATRTFFQGINDKREAWDIECSTGKSYMVMLENSGDVRVLGCDMLRVVSKVECFKTFDEQRRPVQ